MLDVRFDIHGKKGVLVKAVSCQLPESFSELTTEDLMLLARNLNKGATEYELKLLLLHEKAQLKPIHNKWLLKNKSGLYALFQAMAIGLVNSTCDKNILPVINFAEKKYFGPLGDFSNVMLEQFGLTENLFHGYLKGKDDKLIKLLAEALWLPEGAIFNKSVIDEHNPVFAKMSDELVTAVVAVYSSMRNSLFKRFPAIFPQPVPKDTDDTEKTPEKPLEYDFNMYQRMIDDLAGGKFGTYQETCRAIVVDVLFHINRLQDAA